MNIIIRYPSGATENFHTDDNTTVDILHDHVKRSYTCFKLVSNGVKLEDMDALLSTLEITEVTVIVLVHRNRFNVVTMDYPTIGQVTKIHVLYSSKERQIIEHLQRTMNETTCFIKACTFDDKDQSMIIMPKLVPLESVKDKIKSYHVNKLITHLKDIHMANVLHNDLKVDNVMFDDINDELCIIDFGSSYILEGRTEPFRNISCPLHSKYRAPETLDSWDKRDNNRSVVDVLAGANRGTQKELNDEFNSCPLRYRNHITYMSDVFSLALIILLHTPLLSHPTSLDSMLSLDINTRTY